MEHIYVKTFEATKRGARLGTRKGNLDDKIELARVKPAYKAVVTECLFLGHRRS